MHTFTYKTSPHICLVTTPDKTYCTRPNSGADTISSGEIVFIPLWFTVTYLSTPWSLLLQMNIQGSFLICLKKHCRWFCLKSLTKTWGILYNLASVYIMQAWMTKTDLWLRNFLQTTRFRHTFITLKTEIGALIFLVKIFKNAFFFWHALSWSAL